MLTTYEAILQDGRLEWRVDVPPLPPGQAVRVHVTLLEQVPAEGGPSEQGARMAAALERAAAVGAFSDITDPAAWERELRQDRPLPGRGS